MDIKRIRPTRPVPHFNPPCFGPSDAPFRVGHSWRDEPALALVGLEPMQKEVRDGKISHFWATELPMNHVDTVWPYWNLMDFTPEGRPDIPTPPQNFKSEFLEKHYLNRE